MCRRTNVFVGEGGTRRAGRVATMWLAIAAVVAVLGLGCNSDTRAVDRWRFSSASGESEAMDSGTSEPDDTGWGDVAPPPDTADGTIDAPIEEKIPPKAKYLRAENPVPKGIRIRLKDYGLLPGHRIEVIERGDFDYNGGMTDKFAAVFSTSRRILKYDRRHRVPGAIDAGEDFDSGNTYREKKPTDIPEDFEVQRGKPVKIAIPANAEFLIVGNSDPLASDNRDRDGDFAVRIELVR